MKNADVRDFFTTPQEKAVLVEALTSVICHKEFYPAAVFQEAEVRIAGINAGKSLKSPSLLLSVYLSPYFLGESEIDIAFRSMLWAWDHYLCTMIKSGRSSTLIWESFLRLSDEQQEKIRFHRSEKNKPLRLYAQLFYLLNNGMDERKRQELLATLVSEEGVFVSQQLRYNHVMRQQYLQVLSSCGLTQFKTLIQLVSLCPPLADDLDELRFIENDESLAFALLRNSALCETNPEFVANVLLQRKGALAEYKEKVESIPWLLVNAIKGFLAVILPYSLLRLMSPPLPTKILDFIETLPRNYVPDNIIKTPKLWAEADMTFVAFQQQSATQTPLYVVGVNDSFNPGITEGDSPPSPIQPNTTLGLGSGFDESFAEDNLDLTPQ